MDEKNRYENNYDLLLKQQKELNDLMKQQIDFDTDFIWGLLQEKESTRKDYMKAITQIVKYIMIPMSIVLIVFIMSYFFAPYTDYSSNSSSNETYSATEGSNINQGNNLENSSIEIGGDK